MKSISIYIAAIAGIFFIASCNHVDAPSPSNNNSSNNNSVTVSQGKWHVSYYFDKKDETSDYSGYQFEFKDGGTLEAVQGSDVVSGTWQIISDDGKQKMVIGLGVTNDKLAEFNDDWVIVNKTDNLMQLKDDNGTEELHFSK